MKHTCLIFFVLLRLDALAQVYMHDFGTTTISAYPYTVAPPILQTNLSASSWTNSTLSWTSYAGSSGEALAIANSGGAPTITLTFNVASGYKISITDFNFWRQRSATGAQNWSMTINGITVGSGTVPASGASVGTTGVSSPVNDLSGTVTIIISLSGASGAGTFRIDDFTLNANVFPNSYKLLDTFNRNDTIRPAVPSTGGPAWWVEQEPGICFSGSALEKIRIKTNQLELSSCTYANSTCLISPTQATGMNMTGKYPTVFSSASSTMEWYFNMQQTRADPTGFSSGQYGAAFVLGSNTNDPAASNKTGYAIVFGEAGTEDPLRLVSFNGAVFNSTTFTNILSVASPAVKTNYMSIKVTYNPCDNEWSLTARDDGAVAFADPTTITGVGATAVNSTFTSTDLLWLGQAWNHGNSCALVRFDNIYIPKAGTKTGTYTWNGSCSTDFQSAYNWTPRRQCSNPADKLLFNSSSPASSVLANVPDQTIGQLTVTNNRILTVTDVSADGLVSTLNIAGASGTDLQIDAGSSILFDAATAAAIDAVVINLGAGATATIAGTVSFNSQSGANRSHRLQAADANAITVSSTGRIKAMNLQGNPFGSSLPQQTVVFNSGAVYECYSGANPFGLAQPDSKVLFNTGSIYRHYSTNQPSILGRVYADVEFYENTHISTGGTAALTVNNLKILNGTLQFTGSANTQPIHTNIKGDLSVSAGAVFSYDPVVASTLTFNSSMVAQKITNAGTLTLGRDLTVRLNSSFVTPPQLAAETDIKIAGILDIVQGTLRLNGNIHLLSDAVSTASVAPITGALSYGVGRFVVERYIPNHSKAWQFLATPTTGQTINAAWQEGNAPMVPGTAGLGTIITSNVAGTGFDIVAGGGPSMKTYDTTGAGAWRGVSRTDTAIYNKKGYMLFVRGDRTVTSSTAPPTATTLRTKGMIFDPAANIPPVTTISAGKFESIGNPYASAIDFSNDAAVVKSANVQKIFYVWDPKLGGTFNYGGYQTFVKGTGNDYTVLPGGGSYAAAGSVQNLVQSGQAFFVRTVGGTGTITFTENAKVSGSRLVTRPVAPTAGRQLRTSLYAVNVDASILLDAVQNDFDEGYSNQVDILDGLKLNNLHEGLGLSIANSEVLAVERRTPIRPADTISYNLKGLKLQRYEFEFVPGSIARPGLTAFLEDRYLHTLTPVSMGHISRVRFTVTSVPGSADPARFRLVFRQKRNAISSIANTDNNTKPLPRIAVYPNPVHGNSFGLSIYDHPAGKYKLQLVSQSGRILLEKDLQVVGNDQKVPVRLPSTAAGTYKLIILSAGGNKTSMNIVVY